MIETDHRRLSISRQCQLVGIARSSFYYRGKGESALNLKLMRLIDEQFLGTPWYGSRQMARWLRRQGHHVGRKRVRRLMRTMGLTPIYQAPRTSKPHPEHRVYPYLLRNVTIDRPNQAWCADVTYIPMRQGFLYLVAIMDWSTRAVLAWRLSNTMYPDFCVEALQEGAVALRNAGDLQHRPGEPVHQRRLHRRVEGGRRANLDGRPWPLDGQHLHRAAVAVSEIRVHLSAGNGERVPGSEGHRNLDEILQRGKTPLELHRRQDPAGGLH